MQLKSVVVKTVVCYGRLGMWRGWKPLEVPCGAGVGGGLRLVCSLKLGSSYSIHNHPPPHLAYSTDLGFPNE